MLLILSPVIFMQSLYFTCTLVSCVAGLYNTSTCTCALAEQLVNMFIDTGYPLVYTNTCRSVII